MIFTPLMVICIESATSLQRHTWALVEGVFTTKKQKLIYQINGRYFYHFHFEQIFKQIDNSNIYRDNSVEEVNIRLNGTLNKIFTDYEQNGSTMFLRLNSFFPIENDQMLKRLEKQFEEKIIDKNLSVFVKIGS
ncbi:MAG: hypothetical protein ACHQF0_07390 [Chitinophagales bacterium]